MLERRHTDARGWPQVGSCIHSRSQVALCCRLWPCAATGGGTRALLWSFRHTGAATDYSHASRQQHHAATAAAGHPKVKLAGPAAAASPIASAGACPGKRSHPVTGWGCPPPAAASSPGASALPGRAGAAEACSDGIVVGELGLGRSGSSGPEGTASSDSSSRHVGSWMVRAADVLLASPVQIFPSESIINDVAEALDVAPGSLAGPPAVASHATVVPEYAVRVYEIARQETMKPKRQLVSVRCTPFLKYAYFPSPSPGLQLGTLRFKREHTAAMGERRPHSNGRCSNAH